jgi:hypothetical protein
VTRRLRALLAALNHRHPAAGRVPAAPDNRRGTPSSADLWTCRRCWIATPRKDTP